MKETIHSQRHGREIIVGEIDGDLFRKGGVTEKHFFKNWKCYGIQETVFQTLVERGVKKISIEVSSAEPDTPPPGRYLSLVSEWMQPRIKVADHGDGPQRFFPVERMAYEPR